MGRAGGQDWRNSVARGAAYGRQRGRRGGALLCAAMLAGTVLVPSARADLVGCRSDPVAILSNGVTVDLTATINDTEADVQQVAYTLHAPMGTSIVSVLYTSGVLGPKEVLRFFADSTAGVYSSLTQVRTGAHGVAVAAQTIAVPLGGLPARGAATGQDQQALWVQVSL